MKFFNSDIKKMQKHQLKVWVNIFKPLGKASFEYICPKCISLYKVAGTRFISNFFYQSHH